MALRQALCKHEVVLSKPHICIDDTTKETALINTVPAQFIASPSGSWQREWPWRTRTPTRTALSQPLLQNYTLSINKSV